MKNEFPSEVVVDDTAALAREIDRLAKGDGGTILLAPGKDPYSVEILDFKKGQIDAPITIRSLDQDNPAVLDRFLATNRENLTLTDVVVRQTGEGREDYGRFKFILQARGSENVTIDGVTFEGAADGILGLPGSGERGLGFATFKDSTGVTVRDSEISGFHHNFILSNANDVRIENNDVSAFTGDGIRIAGAQDVVIEGNAFRDPFGSTERANHDDMIQFWGTNITQNTERVEIRDNLFHVGEAPSYQMIFGNNEDRDENGWLFEDITVEHNVVFGSNAHMISLGDTRDLMVRYNTVIINDETMTLENDGTFREPFKGFVTVRNSKGETVEKNVAEAFRDKGDLRDNTVITRDSVEPGGNVRDHLANYEALGSGDLRDLIFVPGSPLNGEVGSRLTWFSRKADDLMAVAQVERDALDLSAVTLDASLTRDERGLVGEGEARFVWSFDDGTTRTGQRVEHDFGGGGRRTYELEVRHEDGSVDRIERDIEIEHSTLLDLRTKGGKLVDASPYDASIEIDGNVRVSGSGIELRGAGARSDYVEIPREEDHLQGRAAFDIGLTVDPAGSSKGTFLEIGRVLEASVTKSGAVSFSLATLDTKGKGVTVESAEGVFDDGGAHHLNFVYDGAALKLFVDGELAGQAALTGQVVDGGWYGLRIGNFWGGKGFEGEVSNVLMRGEPSSDAIVAEAYGALARSGSIPLELYAGDGASYDDPAPAPEPQEPEPAPEPQEPAPVPQPQEPEPEPQEPEPEPAPEPQPAPQEPGPQEPVAAEGSGLTLVDARADLALLELGARTVLDASIVEGATFNVEAVDLPRGTDSARFALDGETVRVENKAPYVMLGADGADFRGGLTFAEGEASVIEVDFHAADGGRGRLLDETEARVSVQDGAIGGVRGAADMFVFDEREMGRDTIADFERGDALVFVGGVSAREVLASAEERDGDTVIDFGGGDVLTLEGYAGLTLDDIPA